MPDLVIHIVRGLTRNLAVICSYQAKALELAATLLYRPLPGEELFCQRIKRLNRERVQKVIAILKQNLIEPPPLEEIGRRVGCSPFYLSRMFTQELGKTMSAYLRIAKAKVPHGQFLTWIRRHTRVDPRTAQNYMRLHKWVNLHQRDILERKPHSLRQFYILAGILPEDGPRTLAREKPDELSKLRKLVRRTCLEAAVHIGYSRTDEILKALQPLTRLFEEVGAGQKNK